MTTARRMVIGLCMSLAVVVLFAPAVVAQTPQTHYPGNQGDPDGYH